MDLAELVDTYLNSLIAQNIAAVSALLADDIVIDIPFSLTGDAAPMFVFAGKDQALAYVQAIMDNFSEVRLNGRKSYIVEDGRTAFVEAAGDLVQRGTNAGYRNVYLFKFTASAGRISGVTEYANPVAYAKLMGLPLG